MRHDQKKQWPHCRRRANALFFMIRLQEILDTLAACNPNADFDLVRKAHAYAESAHAGQTLRNGAPYLSQPLAVADTLARLRLDETAIAAGLLHHTVVVGNMEAVIKDIKAAFGEEVAGIVEEANEISLILFENRQRRNDGNTHKMLLAMSKDIRALIVSLADRLYTMRARAYQPPHRQRRIAREAMDIDVPLANRLGLRNIELELKDLCFRYTRPQETLRRKGKSTASRES